MAFTTILLPQIMKQNDTGFKAELNRTQEFEVMPDSMVVGVDDATWIGLYRIHFDSAG